MRFQERLDLRWFRNGGFRRTNERTPSHEVKCLGQLLAFDYATRRISSRMS